MSELFRTYGKEIVALAVPFITWALNNLLRGKVRLQYAQPHGFTFLVQQPLLNAEGKMISPTQTLQTRSLLIQNAGREMASNVEIVLNWKPHCINIWPSRKYSEHIAEDKRYSLLFESLAPGEAAGCEVLAINAETPNVVTVRSDQGVARVIEMAPQPIVGRALRLTALIFLGLGLATAVYLAILLLQFLVLETPLGRH